MRLHAIFVACALVVGLASTAQAAGRSKVYKTAAEAARTTAAHKFNRAPFWARRGLDPIDADGVEDRATIDKSGKTEKHLVVTKAAQDGKPVGRVVITVHRSGRGWIADNDGIGDMVLNGHRFGDGAPTN